MNGLCGHCHRVQRLLYGDTVAPHLIPVGWADCPGGYEVSERVVEQASGPESTVVGSVTETEMVTLLAATMIENGWTLRDGEFVVQPVTAALTLVRAMMLGSTVDDSEQG
jgi:hypothetical protein